MAGTIGVGRQSILRVLAITAIFSSFLAIGPSVGAQPGPVADDRDQLGGTAALRSSPFEPPEATDTTFVVDEGSGLDTGCSYRNAGPLVFDIEVDRVIGDMDKLKASGLLAPIAVLRMPAYDVDYAGGGSTNQPERDRIYFNNRALTPEFLTGENNEWKLNSFNIPVDWINFAGDPGEDRTSVAERNQIRIDIDTANTGLIWCTAIDWASLSIQVARPVLMVHGIRSTKEIWDEDSKWGRELNNLGLPNLGVDLGPGNTSVGGNLDSIQDNARDIAKAVDTARNRWGVDKVNIVSHSKGGLDSREYISSNDTVDTLIQLGTPNAGSPLADAIQRGAIVLTGVVGTAILDSLAGGASYQLTTPYMKTYNVFHGPNPATNYVSLAGDYRYGGWGIFTDATLRAFYGGPSDTIVPVWSVHALSYARHLTTQSTGADEQTKHTQLHTSTKAYDGTNAFLKALNAIPAAPAGITSNTPGVPAATVPETVGAPSATIAGTIAQAQTKTESLVMDGSGPYEFLLYHGSGDLNLALISPSGTRFDRTVGASNPNVEFASFGDVDGFHVESFTVNNPEAGNWTLEVSAPSVTNPAGEEGYVLTGVLLGTSISLTADASQSTYTAGDPIVIHAGVQNGASPAAGATASAKAVLPDGATETTALRDDGAGDDQAAGDGIYSGRLVDTAQSGLYRVLVEAAGSATQPFQRDVLLSVPVATAASDFSGTYTDAGNDTNGNGLWDELIIDVGLTIGQAGQYRLFGLLTDTSGRPIATTEVTTELAAGAQQASLRFDGAALFEQQVDGPYRLSVVRLGEEGAEAVLPLAERVDAYTTQSYRHDDFERPAIFAPGTGTDRGIDTDGDGVLDQLEIKLNVDVLNANTYNWTGRLVDSNGAEIGFATNSGALSQGMNELAFVFDGELIGQNGVDGPYFLKDVLIYSSGQSQAIFEAYSTAAYKATEFTNQNQLQYYPLPRPIRLLDTRPGEPACFRPGAPIAKNTVLTQVAPGTCDSLTIPANAEAVVGNATVVNNLPGAGEGYVTLYPNGAARPTVSNLNYVPGQIVPNAFTVGLGTDGAFNIYAYSSLHVVVDITGYYAPPSAGALYYHPLPRPIRLVDTRPGENACFRPGTPIAGNSVRVQTARGDCDGLVIPASAKAVVGNGTVVNTLPGSGEGYVTLYPTGATRPTVSNLNYVPRQIVPNAFTVGLSTDGAFNIYAYSGLHFIADITGYFSDQAVDENGVGLMYTPLARPIRLLDTRPGEPTCYSLNGVIATGRTLTQPARATCDGLTIPTAAQAVVGNATVVNTASGAGEGYVTLFPSGATRPTVSNLNYIPGQIVPNAFTVGLGSDGAFNIYAYSGLHFIADVTGYFAPKP